jgi:Ca2+-binding RTX toxin-like protein
VSRGDQFGVVVLGTAAADTMTALQPDRAYYFNAGAGNDTVTGGNAADFLVGGGGDDTLRGGGGDDTFIGGPGNDLMDGGAGIDTADYGTATAGVAVNLFQTGVANVSGGAGTDTLISIENLVGSAFSDFMRGDDGANVITDTLGGNDRFEGRGGADTISVSRLQTASAVAATVVSIDGGEGDDVLTFNGGTRFIDRVTIEGGTGNDVINVSGVDASAINAGAGNDDVRISLLGGFNTLTLGAGADILTLTGAGAAASTIARNNRVDDFDGQAGGDRFELTNYLNDTTTFTGYTANSNPFASGHMRLIQSGRDILVQVDRDGAAGSGFGFVTVFTITNGTRSGFTAASMDGFLVNSLTLTGTAGGDFLVGGDNNDVLLGLAEHDELQGGAGNDELRGGAGDDVLRGDAGDDVLFGEDGRDFLFGGAGRDVLHSSAGGDQLFGGDDNDVLIASTADDRMDGGAGTSDTVSYRSASAAVQVDLRLQGSSQATGGSGSDFIVGVENIEGSAFNDLLTGDGNANILLGFGAGDSLVGGGGADYLDGGDGNDVLVGDSGGDTLIGGSGADFFLYRLASDSTAANMDRIVDFQSGTDRLDLRQMATGNDSFAIATQGSDTFVFIDLGRNGSTDSIIRLTGANAIVAGDILFGNATASAAIDWTLIEATAPAAEVLFEEESATDNAFAVMLDIGADELLPVAHFELPKEPGRAWDAAVLDQLFL